MIIRGGQPKVISGTAPQVPLVGVAATGTLTTKVGASTVDADTFTLDDGVNTPVVFEFDSNASVVETATLRAVAFTGGDSADTIRDAIIAAITNAPALGITATSGGPATVDLVNDAVGAAGNVAIVQSAASLAGVAGMSTGVDDGTLSYANNTLQPFIFFEQRATVWLRLANTGSNALRVFFERRLIDGVDPGAYRGFATIRVPTGSTGGDPAFIEGLFELIEMEAGGGLYLMGVGGTTTFEAILGLRVV